MVKHCCWGTCRSDSRYAESEHMEGVSWFPFPKPITQLEKCQRWVKLCGRKNFTVANVNKSTYICSKHFLSGRPTEEHPDPIPAAGTSLDILRAQKRKRRVLVRVNGGNVLEPEEKKIKNDAFCLDVGANIEIAAEEAEETVVTCTSAYDEDNECVPVIKEMKDIPKIDHAYCPLTSTTNVSSAQCQTDITLEDLSIYQDVHLKDQGSLRRSLIVSDVLQDDNSCKFYTGLSLGIFFLLFNSLKEKALRLSYWRGKETNLENHQAKRKGPKRHLSILEEMVMTLIRLRRGIDTTTLGAMFGVKAGTVSKIFFTWTTFLYFELKFLISWPSRYQTVQNLPKCFKYFPSTRCIIDCTEFFVQKPSIPSSQRITWSSYKHHNTFKSLVAITPKGSFCFLSNLFTGSISDKRIVEESGFLDNIERGDDIMADRGFLIRGNLALKGATLNIPPFAFNKQLSGMAVTKTRRIARARIHVERAIGRLKCFNILQGVIPLKLKPILDQVVCLCAALCNLDSQLVK